MQWGKLGVDGWGGGHWGVSGKRDVMGGHSTGSGGRAQCIGAGISLNDSIGFME